MIRHLFKIIWNERKVNSWILIEYIIVFCILWFCCDYLSFLVKSYYEPTGFNIENTYRIFAGERKIESEGEEGWDTYALAMTFLDRIKQHPEVESVSISSSALPYGGSSSHTSMLVNEDSIWSNFRERYVSTSYFDVFKIALTSGRIFDWTDMNAVRQRIISPDRNGYFGGSSNTPHPVSQIKKLRQGNGENDDEFEVIGVAEKLKVAYFDPYHPGIFVPLKRENIDFRWNEIALRVKAGTSADFPELFAREMRQYLNVGPYFLSSIVSMEKEKQNMIDYRIADDLNSVYSITAFLVINIFLGIVGTFWYRTQSRQSEMGLRIALGATGRNVMWMVCLETLLLLSVASIIGVNICINLAQTDLLSSLALPMGNRTATGMGFEQDVINFAFTFLFLAIISLLAVWYPAKQAAAIQPAEALRNE